MCACRLSLRVVFVLFPLGIGNLNGQFVETVQPPGFLQQWGNSGSGVGQFVAPRGVALDIWGNAYITDTNNHRIQKFDSHGNFWTYWGASGSDDSQFSYPTGVAIDASGQVYVADTFNHRVQKFDSAGNFLSSWGSSGSGDGQFAYPWGVAVDASGNVYVADKDNNRIQKFDSAGNFLTKWGSSGSGSGQFASPAGVAADAFGNVWVADHNNHRIQKFDSFGVFLTSWGAWPVGSSGSGYGEFNYPWGVAVDISGNVYVGDQNNHRIQKFDSRGYFLTSWGSNGTDPGQFDSPHGVAVDSFGKVYVVDSTNSRIQKFAPVREFLVEGEDVKLDVNRVSLTPANKIVMELKNNGSAFFRFTNTFNGQQWTLNPLGTSFTFDNLNNPGQEFRLYNTGRLVITPSSLGSPSFDLAATGDLFLAGDLTASGMFYPSDRNQKQNIRAVDLDEVLEKVASMPVSRWNYQRGDPYEHIGPMAQDFYALFGVGKDEKHLSPTDTAGVALVAIQGLNRKLQEKEQQIAELKAEKDAEIATLREKLAEIESLKAELAEIRAMLGDR